MKRILLLILILFMLRQWFYYSNPGSFSREDLQSISDYTTLAEILFEQDAIETPQLVYSWVAHAGGIRNVGYCVLQEGSSHLLVLTRGFPPAQAQHVNCILIPRRCIQIGSHYLAIAAMVAFKPAQLHEDSSTVPAPDHSF